MKTHGHAQLWVSNVAGDQSVHTAIAAELYELGQKLEERIQ
jgi:hypothetical protein